MSWCGALGRHGQVCRRLRPCRNHDGSTLRDQVAAYVAEMSGRAPQLYWGRGIVWTSGISAKKLERIESEYGPPVHVESDIGAARLLAAVFPSSDR